jgi:KRAB domain-containing zinc finger protein
MFGTQLLLNQHLLRVKKNKPIKCIACAQEFTKRIDYSSHLRTAHTAFYCTLCNDGKKFKTSKCLSAHINFVHKKVTHLCNVCNKAFSRKESVTKHIMNVHNKEKDFKCGRCGRFFGTENSVWKHLQYYARINKVCSKK